MRRTERTFHLRRLPRFSATPAGADDYDPSAFAFFSEVEEHIQRAFIVGTGVDEEIALRLADRFSELAGYNLPLRRQKWKPDHNPFSGS